MVYEESALFDFPPDDDVRCLSVRQPDACLIVSGIKGVENRSRRPPRHLIGRRIAIHASLSRNERELSEEQARDASMSTVYYRDTRGAVIGDAILVGFYEPGDEPKNASDAIWWDRDCYGWILRDARPAIEPIPAKGKLYMFRLQDDRANKRQARGVNENAVKELNSDTNSGTVPCKSKQTAFFN